MLSPMCEQLDAFVDGELSAQAAEAFRVHLGACLFCQEALHDAMQLRALAPPPERAKLLAFRPRVRGIIAVLSAAAALVLVFILRSRSETAWPPPLDATRAWEVRLSDAGLDRYRSYDVSRSAPQGAVGRVSFGQLAALEERRDWHRLGLAAFLNGDRAEAERYLQRAPVSAATLSDRAALAVIGRQWKQALALCDEALALEPDATRARWNKALALAGLRLPLGAARELMRIAERGEPGWSEEARARAEALRAEAEARRNVFQDAKAASKALIGEGVLPSAQVIAAVPGRLRHAFYEALREAETLARAEALWATGVVPRALDKIDFSRRAPFAKRYAAYLAGDPPPRAEQDAFLSDARAARQSDIVLGALQLWRRSTEQAELYSALAETMDDPWMRLFAVQERARKLAEGGHDVEAEAALRTALVECPQSGIPFRCAVLELDLAKLLWVMLRLDEAETVGMLALQHMQTLNDWSMETQALRLLAANARFNASYAMAEAYVSELGLHEPDDCVWQTFVHSERAKSALEQREPARARAEVAAAPECNPPMFHEFAGVLAELARDAQTPEEKALARQAIEERRKNAPQAGPDELMADYFEAQLLLVTQPSAGKDELRRIIAEAKKLPAWEARALSAAANAYATLATTLGQERDFGAVVEIVAEAIDVAVPERCAFVVAADNERSVAVALGANGEQAGRYVVHPSMRIDVEQLLEPAAEALFVPCARVSVLALPRFHGRAKILPPRFAWSFATAKKPLAPARDGVTLSVSRVEPPAALGLAPLSPWAAAKAGEVSLQGPAATPRRVLEAMAEASTIAIHAHGLVDAGQASVLVLSPDERGRFSLSAKDVTSQRLHHAPLVILAACHSAQGASTLHRAWSLPVAFVQAGASAVIGSPDPMPDQQAGPFFDEVLAAVADGRDPAVALRDVRQRWLASGDAARAWLRSVVVFQ